MKKRYFKPETIIIHARLPQLLSSTINGSSGSAAFTEAEEEMAQKESIPEVVGDGTGEGDFSPAAKGFSAWNNWEDE